MCTRRPPPQKSKTEDVVETEIGKKLEDKVTWGLKATVSSSDFEF